MGASLCKKPETDPRYNVAPIPSHPPDEEELVVDNAPVTLKVILLGAGESGKSTIYKQMMIEYDSKYNPSKLISEKERIIQGFFMALEEYLKAIVANHGDLGNPDWDALYEQMYRKQKDGQIRTKISLTPNVVQLVKGVWKSDRGQALWAQRFELSQVTDSLEYFVEAIDRLAAVDYVPTEDDFLKCRITTTGVHNQTFQYNQVFLNVVDVGGQRAERRKWIRCFSGVKAVLFVAAINEFDQKLFEAGTVDRYAETKDLFRKTLSFMVFKNVPFLLFLNKQDLFLEKLKMMEQQGRNLDDFFPHLRLGTNYENAAAIILNDLKKEFESMCPRGRIHATFMTATSRSTFRQVFDKIAYSVLSDQIDQYFVAGGDPNDFVEDPGVEQGF